MKRILSVDEMSAADKNAVDIGIMSLVLMERAALCVVEEILKRNFDISRVLVLCGPGNNGGDGACIARLLAERNISSEIMLFGSPEKRSAQLKQQLTVCDHYGIKYVDSYEKGRYTLVIDAIFGIGLKRELSGRIAELADEINKENIKVVAVDIPSGIDGDSGRVLGTAVKADLTVTFAAAKIGHYLYPGASYCGEIVVKQIGIPVPDDKKGIYNIEEKDISYLSERDESGNKGTFGKLLVIAGSKDICGAAYLTAASALRSGIGMVKILTHSSNRTALNMLIPEALIDTYDDFTEEMLAEEFKWADGVVVGPGLGTQEPSVRLLKSVISICDLPIVFDADALNIIASQGLSGSIKSLKKIVTPHVGEMSRLINSSAAQIKSSPIKTALDFARKNDMICILKDARTVTAYPDGRAFINTSGCSALATAGSGDVLSGLVGGYMLQSRNIDVPCEAIAVFIHGMLGDMAAKGKNKNSVIAGDLIKILEKIDY